MRGCWVVGLPEDTPEGALADREVEMEDGGRQGGVLREVGVEGGGLCLPLGGAGSCVHLYGSFILCQHDKC